MKKNRERIIVAISVLLLASVVVCFTGCYKKSPPDPVENLILETGVENGDVFIKATWDSVEGVIGYHARWELDPEDAKDLEFIMLYTVVEETTVVFENLVYDKLYTVTIYAINRNSLGYESYSTPVSAEITCRSQ